MSDYSEGSSTDINIFETLAALWAHKFLIVTLTLIVLVLSFLELATSKKFIRQKLYLTCSLRKTLISLWQVILGY